MTYSCQSCEWCGEAILAAGGVGRPRRYCRRSHRQRAYEARRLAARRLIDRDQVLVRRSTWDGLRAALGELQQASGTVAADLASAQADGDYVLAVARLSSAIADLQELAVEPTARR